MPFLRKAAAVSLLALLLLSLLPSLIYAAAQEDGARPARTGPAVYVVPVKQTIESGLEAFLDRAYREAEEAQAEMVVLEINTLGGAVISAENIGERIQNSSVPTTAFVDAKAISAGAFIALNADQIIMQPGSTMGAAAVVDGTGTLIDNPKTVSYWVKEMQTAAEQSGRDPSYAVKMVDPSATLEGGPLADKYPRGTILTLSAEEALEVGYAEHIAGSVEEAVQWLGLDGRALVEFEPTFAERLASWITSPLIKTLLFIVGLAGVAIELFVPGFGVPGILGAAAFGLYFFGHYVAGFAGMESVVLFVVGIGLLIAEVFVPSFGILGLVGTSALIFGIMTAAFDKGETLVSLGQAFLIAIVIVVIVAVIFKKRGIWNRFILSDRMTADRGYNSNESKQLLIGLKGTALTPLRPSGTADIGDARVDVVTSGEYIDRGQAIQVLFVEGSRVVVRAAAGPPASIEE
ncbi:nodulation protein NfeD [Paenibacillus sp. IB182496]|uniref:Nodulation protein NfeD n=1 Tax=Paenibacillus sabuli TaxID=2772509 RepID=A0A927GR19_9BACL|nr:nodulation protein NfeD [Paenibacillus sabuli]MBD2844455.1 nodulation protein NfeD [Paenibacillus sabuli]